MAVIGKIRKYSGLLIAVIGIALAAFVLSDFFKGGNGNSMEDMAIIDGDRISYREFEAMVDQQMELYKMNAQTDRLSSDEIYRIREQTWRMYLRELVIGNQLEDLGITVSKDELKNIIVGNNPHQYIVQNFSDPSTGQFDQSRVQSFWANMDKLDPEIKDRLISLEQEVKKDQLFNKYFSLIKNGFYVTSLEAKEDFNYKNKVAAYQFIMYEYKEISDSSVAITDADYQSYYEEVKKVYEQEETRAIDYVVFDVLPSQKDEAAIQKEINELKKEFENTTIEKTAEFVNSTSDERYDSVFFSKGELPVEIDSTMFNQEEGFIYGPYVNENAYTLAKLVDVQYRPDSLKAEHILVAYRGAYSAGENVSRTKTKAKELADSLLNVAKSRTSDFDTLAKQYSDDPSVVNNAGDMGWFAENSGFAYQFKQACIDNKVGDVVIAETIFGYHIINVTGKTEANKKVRVAFVKLYNEPSDETFQNIYAKASSFAGENKTLDQFEKAVVENGYNKRSADYLRNMDYRIPGLDSPREIIRWTFDEERNTGDVSKAFDIPDQDKFVVVVLKQIRPDGIPSMESVKDRLRTEVVKRKKAEKIKEIIAAENSKDLATLANKLNLTIDSVKRATFSTPNIPRAGREPEVVGTIFAMEKGTVSGPIEGNRGVFVVQVSDVVEAPEIEDYTAQKSSIANKYTQRIAYSVFDALKKAADIEDNRGLYY